MSKETFSISNFESAFYYFLYMNHAIDSTEFHRKMFYNGMTLLVKMTNSRIVSVIDLSHDGKILYTLGGVK
jgi:hypothetical protein